MLLLVPQLAFAGLMQSLEGADSLQVGDVFTLKIQCDYPIGKINIPDSLETFAVVGSKASGEQGWLLRIAPLRTGALSFPRLQVIPADGSMEPEYTDGFRVYVLSVLAEGDTLLRDIKPLERYPLQLPLWIYVLLVLIAIALALYLLLKKPRKAEEKKAEPAKEQPVMRIPAWQEALYALENLLKQGLAAKQDWHALYFGFSEILRGFLEKEYRFGALEMTVSEISRILQHKAINNRGEVEDFLQFCDLVKFAKAEPDFSSTDTRIAWLKAYLQSFGKANQGERSA